jgi:hypothetical protein
MRSISVGTVYSARLDGSDARAVLTGQGSLTGIAFVDLSNAHTSLR